MSFVSEKFPENPRMAPEKYGMYVYDTAPISFIKSYGFYFRVGEIFARKTLSQKTQKLTFPRLQYLKYLPYRRVSYVITGKLDFISQSQKW